MHERQDIRRTSNRRGFTHRQQCGQRIAHTRAEAGDSRSADRSVASTSR
ncbi:hypothetical protein GA0070614_3641 [Micromonospora coxensis]|uniref:Uncharacterized protein n=1 Tax=Micromonospora coxensis TaxID=356852 RepID=A0A1C5IYV4_9ACTN|nr:hypothetical protein GA0070614_3641 [Micromonospora coxensis]